MGSSNKVIQDHLKYKRGYCIIMNIIFSGTPDFSLPALQYVYKNHNLTAVITQPDKPTGRGLKVVSSPVKNYCVEHNIKYFQPIDLSDDNFLSKIKKLNPDVLVDISYGKIIPDELIIIPDTASFNIHPSLLPGYKGPSPIRWVLIHGENHTGVSSHIITKEIDSGKLICQKKIKINHDDIYEKLYKKLSLTSVDVLKTSLNKIEKNQFQSESETEDTYKIKNFYARKFNQTDFIIDWNKNSIDIYNLIRGIKNKPTAFTLLNDIKIKIFETEIVKNHNADESFEPGEIVTANKNNGLIIKTLDGFLKIIELQSENKKRLNYKDFLNGTKLNIKERLQNVKN